MAHYFASDFHLGLDLSQSSREREQLLCEWLNDIAHDAEAIYIVGDLFDYWFEYKNAIPKIGTRFIIKLAELAKRGVHIHYFTGNHDMWVFNYFTDEYDFHIHKKPISLTIYNKKLLVGHGDGLGPGDHGYKFIKKIFSNPLCQWLYARIHPNMGIPLMKYISQRSRHKKKTLPYLGKKKEWLCIYSEDVIKSQYYDYLIFGHRHLCIDMKLSNDKSRYINLGDWLIHRSYLRLDQTGASYQFYKNIDTEVINENT